MTAAAIEAITYEMHKPSKPKDNAIADRYFASPIPYGTGALKADTISNVTK